MEGRLSCLPGHSTATAGRPARHGGRNVPPFAFRSLGEGGSSNPSRLPSGLNAKNAAFKLAPSWYVLYFQHMNTVLPSLFALLFLTSCTALPVSGSYGAPASPAYMPDSGSADANRLLRREGSLTVKARSLEEGAARCVSLVQSHQGRLEKATLTEDDYCATIRVPSRSLEPLMDALGELGRVTHRSVSQEDVTEQFHDLEAEIKNTRALRDRLRALLAKATTVKDTLAIEKELVRVQTKLDQLEGRLKRLRSQIAYSELAVRMKKGLIAWKKAKRE